MCYFVQNIDFVREQVIHEKLIAWKVLNILIFLLKEYSRITIKMGRRVSGWSFQKY